MHVTAMMPRQRSGSVLAVLALLLGLPHQASAAPDSPQCRIECASPFADRVQNTGAIRTCLARCATRSAALGSANVSITSIMPAPQTPWTQGPGVRRTSTQPVDVQREIGRQAQLMAKREEVRLRRPGAMPNAAPVRTARADVRPAAALASAPAQPGGSSFLTSIMAAEAAVPAPALRAAHGAIYVAAAPSRGYGLVVGAADRGAAHHAAEGACLGGTGNACRLAGDFVARCGAVAHGLRSNGALIVTAHPSTYIVTAATAGTGTTREEAERQALSACAQRGRGLSCRVTEARCAE